ncbi:hypothetical protein [Burkholderia pseudomallei]|uniref:hypothetical protein n=1 Tax=Burkholderia pseudomallei TaxID=28450 RepID=UPI0011C4CD51|nr:hypothetical protein [Burkholderia pseudomallei]
MQYIYYAGPKTNQMADGVAMKERKDTPMSFRASARFKTALARAAQHENRSQANLLETLVFEFCRLKGIEVPDTPTNQQD